MLQNFYVTHTSKSSMFQGYCIVGDACSETEKTRQALVQPCLFFKRRWTIRCLAIKMENTGYGRTQTMKKDKNVDAVAASRLYHKCRLRRIKERGKIWRHYHSSPGWGSWIIQMKSILENNIQLSICSEAVGQTIIFLEAIWSQIASLESSCTGWFLFSAFGDFELD